jgi:hypothetical protein
LFSKKHVFIGHLLADSFLQSSEGLSTLVLWGLLSIILLTLVSFACVSAGDLIEPGDFAFLEYSLSTGSLSHPSCPPSSLAGAVTLILIFECLRGHIGEKRPDDGASRIISPLFSARFSPTALYSSAVFLFVPPILGATSISQPTDSVTNLMWDIYSI